MKPLELFKAEDFNHEIDLIPQHSNAGRKMAAETANRVFNDWLKSAVRVYGISFASSFTWSDSKDKYDTHQALLVCVEEIEKKPCEHEAYLKEDISGDSYFIATCIKCGVKLTPVAWKEE